MNPKTPSRKEIEELINRLDVKGEVVKEHADGIKTVISRPILIGDVLDRAFMRKTFCGSVYYRGPFNADRVLLLVERWAEVGTAKSLQEIFAGMKWEKEQLDCTGEKSEHGKLKCRCPKFSERIVPTPSPHCDLFSFLLTLGL